MILAREERRMLRSYLRIFPVVLLAGPRQSGKTTLLRSEFVSARYLDLEDATDFDILGADPEGILRETAGRIVIDEAQRLPALFPALRVAVDRRRRPGSFVLTGSASPDLMRQAGESLAGRIGTLELTPFGASELAVRRSWLAQRWFWGGFPPLYSLASAAAKTSWLEQYVRTFLERDVPALGLRVPAPRLRKLWMMLVHVHGGLLNVSDLARSLDLNAGTIGHHLDILEGAFMIRRLQPYHANIGKRLVKSPKVYLRDTGLLHHLAGLRHPKDLETWPGRGASWEGYVIEELIRRAKLRWPAPNFYFWRTQAGAEADLLIESGRERIAVEIKAGATLDSRGLFGIRQCMKDLRLKRGYVIYRGERALALSAGLAAVPWAQLEKGGLPGAPRGR